MEKKKQKYLNMTRGWTKNDINKKHHQNNYERTIQLLTFIALNSILGYLSSSRME
jgi:hypothetical protein